MKKIISKLIQTTPEYSSLIMRLALGIMILPHGLQKTLGLFGGNGFAKTLEYFTNVEGFPIFIAVLPILAESFGALGLIFGCLTRISAFGVGAVMLVAMITQHLSHGFFMNWYGTQAGEGIEFFILAIGLSAALIIKGGGALSIDRKLSI
ncbi:DoxX family protein [Fluviispira multicolorata]|uniref:DoxX family membrane protein n=1 Tax=Fluviispira multicolorata TaxID=2654512 RepID=A0A833JDK0_9BACT|nr:DoxX family protein [Fluviispira multicolorata]KAB8028556.1 DoxX family membrane protein [Fluviispira multicolorata]